MTAFARAEGQNQWGTVIWEIRSVNHRYLDIQLRLPEDFRSLEPSVRERLSTGLHRGKVECSLRYRLNETRVAPLLINHAALDELLQALQKIATRYPQMHAVSGIELLNWPGVLQPQEIDFEPLQTLALEVLQQALQDLLATREREGERLGVLLRQRCDALEALIERARRAMPRILQGVRERLRARLQEVTQNLDQERLEQEMALLAQRLDVDEEMDRLSTHLQEIRQILSHDGPVGRRLDFLMQELNREANTLGSKSTDSETTAISVEMKVVIEQMREQIQNIE